jgi:hypothetical protein
VPATTQPGHGPASGTPGQPPLPRPYPPAPQPPAPQAPPYSPYQPPLQQPPPPPPAYQQPPQPAYPPQPGYPPQPAYQPPPQAQQQPYPPQPQPQPQPQPPYPPQPQAGPPHPPGQQPAPFYPPPAPPPGYAPHPQHGLPQAYLPGSPPGMPASDSFTGFLQISIKRAFRLRIEPNEVLPSERAAMAHAPTPIVDENFQAFLAWRRSVLFVVAVILVPLIVLRTIDVVKSSKGAPGLLVFLHTLPLIAEAIFCVVAFLALAHWTQWQRQRRQLLRWWLVFFLAPFVTFLYPVREFLDGAIEGGFDPQMMAMQKAQVMAISIAYSLNALLVLAPKAISLMPGLIRAAIVTKMLFAGASAPGWLIMIGAPIYGLLTYVLLVVPYQITGSGFFVLAIISIIAAQVMLGRAGYALAKPMTQADALMVVRKVRTSYLVCLALGGLFVVVALYSLISQMNIPALTVVTALLSFQASVLILGLITTDLLITGFDRARGLTAGTTALTDEYNRKLSAFIGVDSMQPPPPGPAPGNPLP